MKTTKVWSIVNVSRDAIPNWRRESGCFAWTRKARAESNLHAGEEVVRAEIRKVRKPRKGKRKAKE